MKYFLMVSAIILGFSGIADAKCCGILQNRPVLCGAKEVVVGSAKLVRKGVGRVAVAAKRTAVGSARVLKGVVQSRPGIVVPKARCR